VRRFSSADLPEDLGAERYFTASWIKEPARLSAEAGAHRIVWDLRYPRPRAPFNDPQLLDSSKQLTESSCKRL
jgi:hypothetical protein